MEIKCALISDINIGKTTLIYTYRDNKFPGKEYYPKCIDDFQISITVDGEDVELTVANTYDRHDYHNLRPLVYPKCDVIIICFSIVTPESYKNVREKCYPELLKYCKNLPTILVGTKMDLRDDKEILLKLKARNEIPISHDQGLQLSAEINAQAYTECSSLTGVGVKMVFEEATKVALIAIREHKKTKKKCVLQ